jgi:hypothetical protein
MFVYSCLLADEQKPSVSQTIDFSRSDGELILFVTSSGPRREIRGDVRNRAGDYLRMNIRSVTSSDIDSSSTGSN